MKHYFIKNRITNEEAETLATSAQEACIKIGWLIGDCYVKVL